MKTMAAGVFKTKCLAVMDEVQKKREPVVITKRGRPVAKLVPITDQPDPIFGFLKGEIIAIHGDIVGPIVPLEDWECLK